MTREEIMAALEARFCDVIGRPPTALESCFLLVRPMLHAEFGGVVEFQRFGNALGVKLHPIAKQSEVQS